MLIAYTHAAFHDPSFVFQPTLHERVTGAVKNARCFFTGMAMARVRRVAERAAEHSPRARNPYRPNTRRYVMWETSFNARLLHIELMPRAMADDWRN